MSETEYDPISRRHIIKGHPSIETVSEEYGQRNQITVCAECGTLNRILYLAGDRFLCTVCKNEGSWKPTMIPVSRPTRRR